MNAYEEYYKKRQHPLKPLLTTIMLDTKRIEENRQGRIQNNRWRARRRHGAQLLEKPKNGDEGNLQGLENIEIIGTMDFQ